MKLFTVYVKGWGDREDEFYAFGTFKDKAKAEAHMAQLVKEWDEQWNTGLEEGDERYEVDCYVEEHALQDG